MAVSEMFDNDKGTKFPYVQQHLITSSSWTGQDVLDLDWMREVRVGVAVSETTARRGMRDRIRKGI